MLIFERKHLTANGGHEESYWDLESGAQNQAGKLIQRLPFLSEGHIPLMAA